MAKKERTRQSKTSKASHQALEQRLVDAVGQRDVVGAKQALADGAKADCWDKDGQFGLSVAAAHGDLAMMKVLVDAGANVNGAARDYEVFELAQRLGETVDTRRSDDAEHSRLEKLMTRRLEKADEEEKRRLLGWPAVHDDVEDPAEADPALRYTGYPPLVAALGGGHNAVVDYLMEHGADADAHEEMGPTPLALAVEKNDPDMALLLLKAGADIEKAVYPREERSGPSGFTPLSLAVQRGYRAVFDLLLEYGADPDPSRAFENPLDRAIMDGRRDMAETLLQWVEPSDDLLEQAASRGYEGVDGLLRWAEVTGREQKVAKALKPLRDAIDAFDLAGVQRELAREMDINQPYSGGSTVLSWAVGFRSWLAEGVPILKALLDAGAEPNLDAVRDVLPDEERHHLHPPLVEHVGDYEREKDNVEHGLESLRLLLAAGADPNLPGRSGETALHVAVQAGWVEGVRLLMEAGGDSAVATAYGRHALRLAHELRPTICSKAAKAQIIEFLQPRSAEQKQRMATFDLLDAACDGNAKRVGELLATGADATGPWGFKVLRMGWGSSEVARLLVEAGAAPVTEEDLDDLAMLCLMRATPAEVKWVLKEGVNFADYQSFCDGNRHIGRASSVEAIKSLKANGVTLDAKLRQHLRRAAKEECLDIKRRDAFIVALGGRATGR